MSASNHPNRHIQCSARDCRNHCASGNYCSLDCICIGGGSRAELGARAACCNYRGAEDFDLRASSELCMGKPYFGRTL